MRANPAGAAWTALADRAIMSLPRKLIPTSLAEEAARCSVLAVLDKLAYQWRVQRMSAQIRARKLRKRSRASAAKRSDGLLALSHRTLDQINAAQDRQIAARLRRDRRPLAIAWRNLRRWMVRDGRKVRAVFQEWHRILSRLSRSELADFLESQTPMARRLRQSSPLVGILSDLERQALRRRHAKARA